jgi:hypothetical protein
MKYTPTEERPSGCIHYLPSDKEALEARGWTVNMHTEHYANFIGYESNMICIGFTCYIDHLETTIETSPTGYYGDQWQESFNIESQADLDRFMAMVDSFIHFKL